MIKNNKKGFISSFTIYSFFVVLVLLMIATLLTYVYKRKLASSVKVNNQIKAVNVCDGKTLADCLLITYYVDTLGKTYDNIDNISKVKSTISSQTYSTTDASSTGLFAANDESNTKSYFYRGETTNNYVSFAGYRWRVVRINGTGTVRLILDDFSNSSSLKTNYNKNSKKIGGILGDTKENIGLMYGKSSTLNNKDEIYGNINNSDILNSLYSFYDTYLSNYSSYISTSDYYCANKNPLSDSDKETNDEFDKIVKSVCQQSGWEWACSNNFAKSLNYANYKQIYYQELQNIMSYLDGTSPSYVCNNSGGTANSVCNKALNLSNYSTTGKIKYAFSSSDVNGKKIETISSKCGYTENNTITYRDSYLNGLANNITYSGKSDYNSVVGNGSLTKPIGLISATEAYLSGVGFSSNGTYKSSISSDTFSNYWTSSAVLSDLTPNILQETKVFGFTDGLYYDDVMEWTGNYYFAVNSNNNLRFTLGYILTDAGQDNTPYTRPVINLKSCVKYTSGDGTKDNPYIISDTGC